MDVRVEDAEWISLCGREGKEVVLDRRKGGAAMSLSVMPANLREF